MDRYICSSARMSSYYLISRPIFRTTCWRVLYEVSLLVIGLGQTLFASVMGKSQFQPISEPRNLVGLLRSVTLSVSPCRLLPRLSFFHSSSEQSGYRTRGAVGEILPLEIDSDQPLIK